MNYVIMKKNIKIITISLCSIMYLALGGSAFALSLKPEGDTRILCEKMKIDVENFEQAIKNLEKNKANYPNAEKIEKLLKATLEQTKIGLDQAQCNDKT